MGIFRNLSDEDLKAVFGYLRSLRPVKHRVDNTEDARYCKVCRGKHGFGERNRNRAEVPGWSFKMRSSPASLP
jgi:hypothetical protein